MFSISVSCSCETSMPSFQITFIPLYSGGLWDAVIITPPSMRWFLTAYCNAGVEAIPAKNTLHPVDVNPEITALANIGPLVLASCPISKSFLPKNVPIAEPTFMAISGVNSLLTSPRMPFVPKSFFELIFSSPCLNR